MPLRFVVLLLLLAPLFGQQPAPVTLIGIIESATGNEIRLRTQGRSTKLHVDASAEVRKGGVYHDVSPLRAGNEVSVQCIRGAAGDLVARKISADAVKFRAVVKNIAPNRFEVVPSAGQKLGAPPGRVVYLHPATVFSPPGRERLAAGQEVHVVGFDLGDGFIDGARITIYNTDLPTDFPDAVNPFRER